jgi:eukaryotic-like serine/threonine-protein kinase
MTTGSELRLIEELFYAALPLDGQGRAALLSSHPEVIRQEVEALLEEDKRGSVVARAVRGAATGLALERNTPSPIGTRVGAYEVKRELGSGGMGTVFLGVRADETYQRQVAIKFVRSEYDTALFRERFQHERRILGRLDHPNVARLLDAGATPAGQPYFVMEYVDGEPITVYARRHQLNNDARLAMFVKVCDAVQYAHQNLIVHRDLKPGNILVDASGNPKLLDFGIAKLLGEGGRTDQTIAAGFRILTPDYASPEHAAGLPVTTSSDVYSLGAILYELFLGQRPGCLREGQDEIDPPRALGADLGGIVRKAMHRNPEARYPSASDLREDLIRLLHGRPIRARSYSVPERIVHFTRRYRGLLAATLIVAGGLAGAAVFSFRSAQRAEEARQEAVRERNRAETERQRAEAALERAEFSRQDAIRNSKEAVVQKTAALQERNLAHLRFNEQRQLLGQFIDEVQDQLEGLPGGGPAREQSLSLAITYLENMAKDRDAGVEVSRNLALAYLRLGDLRSGQTSSSEQPNPKVAAVLYEKANQILTRPAMGQDRESLSVLVRLRSREAELFDYFGQRAKALAALEEGRNVGRQLLVGMDSINTEAAVPLIRALNASAFRAVQYRELDQALEWAGECRQLALQSKQTQPVVDHLAACTTMEGRAYWLKTDYPKAVTAFQKAIEIRERMLREKPANNRNRRSLMLAYSHLAGVYYGNLRPSLGDIPGALQALKQVREHALRISQSDPSDRLAQKDVAISSNRYGDLLLAAKQYEQAVELLEESATMLEALLPAMPEDVALRNELLFVFSRLPLAYEVLPKRNGEVEGMMRKATALADKMAAFPSLTATMYASAASAYVKLGKRLWPRDEAEAAKLIQRAKDWVEAGRKKFPSSSEITAFERRDMADLPGVPKSH